jgi:hypothetical protein
MVSDLHGIQLNTVTNALNMELITVGENSIFQNIKGRSMY